MEPSLKAWNLISSWPRAMIRMAGILQRSASSLALRFQTANSAVPSAHITGRSTL